jgi:hypothetical protein
MDELFQAADWVALAGLRRPHRGPAPKSYVATKMKWAKGRHVHWLGYTRAAMINRFKPYSVDSSNWASGVLYGNLPIYLGRGVMRGFTFPKVLEDNLVYDSKMRRAIQKLGITPDRLADPFEWRYGKERKTRLQRTTLCYELPIRSYVRYSLDVRKKLGTRFFLAIGTEDFGAMMEAKEIVT